MYNPLKSIVSYLQFSFFIDELYFLFLYNACPVNKLFMYYLSNITKSINLTTDT